MRFSSSDGVSLEGELRLPEGPVLASAVICHAHPRRGGSKDHPILWALRNELAQRGAAVLSFNFRGTMRSAGSYGGGHAEIRDVEAAVGFVRSRGTSPTIVCGWSFGAAVALREAITDGRVDALVLIGMPLRHEGADVPPAPGQNELRALRPPVFLLAGEEDPHCPRPELEAFGRSMRAAEVAILPGTDHFLWRREREAAQIAGEFASRVMQRARDDGRPGGSPP